MALTDGMVLDDSAVQLVEPPVGVIRRSKAARGFRQVFSPGINM